MKRHQRIWTYFKQHRAVSIVAAHVVVVTVMGLVWLSTAFAPALFGALAQAPCAKGDQTYVVRGGDTLGGIAVAHATTWQSLASYNHLANPNIIFVNQHICIQSHNVVKGNPASDQPAAPVNVMTVKGRANPFSYGQCTWWADQRYFQLHGFYVPWSTNANAWQWQNRAQDFHWHVSSRPTVGSIMNLQPGVQGAQGLGHVGVVEIVMSNGHVLASSMNWGPNFSQVTNFEFTPGPGVSFISA